MTGRKYINQGIVDLEKVFKANQQNQKELQTLKCELEFRKTKRAKSLLDKVIAQISKIDTRQNKLEQTVEGIHAELLSSESEASQKSVFTSPDIDWAEVLSEFSKSPHVNSSVGQKPMLNRPLDILDTWTVLEALSPQSYRKPKDLVIGTGSVAHFGADQLPWEMGEKSAPRKKLYYLVYLGAVDLGKTSQYLLDVYKDDRQEIPTVQGHAALAVIVLDKAGIPLTENSIAISSYGWAVGQAMRGKLENLRLWGKAEKSLNEGLEKIVLEEDKDGKTLPLTHLQINNAYDWLVRNCALHGDMVSRPSFAIRMLQPFGRSQPEPPLLNSFYLNDLHRARELIEHSNVGQALRFYMGMEQPESRHDLLTDLGVLETFLEPNRMPLGRWPIKGRFPLVFLQQAAVNIAREQLKSSGLYSVNGPPGTGKTTLLRDVVASVVIDRAIAMRQFEQPERAFTKRGRMNARGKVDLYEIDASLKGHEVLVASSNNKAVENISKELPLSQAIDGDIEFNYFKPLSDSLLPDGESTWGLIATVLGNSKNRSTFVNNAWWEYDTSLYSYFMYMTGSLEYQEDEDGQLIIPSIVAQCDPPKNLAEALQRWRIAREEFNTTLKKAELIQSVAQKGLDAKRVINDLELQIRFLDKQRKEAKDNIDSLEITINSLRESLSFEEQKADSLRRDLDRHLQSRPGWIARLLRLKAYKEWKQKNSSLHTKEELQWQSTKDVKEALLGQQEARVHKIKELGSTSERHKRAIKLQRQAVENVKASNQICGNNLVTKDYLFLSHEDRQLSTPVYEREAHLVRDELFVSAISLHKAFIDAAATPIRQNLAAFMAVLGNKRLPHDSRELLSDIWATGFMLSPVISTAFASIDRMLDTLPSQSIGWLLIDEAGQSTPQQAVGAIMRAQRVLAVGDPLQIEPVVTTPKPLSEGIASYMGVDSFKWVAPGASVQSVADQGNGFGATINQGLTSLWIGSPLLVHRRCEEPMFSISNQLAYNGQMVKATINEPTQIANVFGCKSQWFDVSGQGDDKWCEEEGELVACKILEAASEMNGQLDLFVISPFRIVAQRMRDRMCKQAEDLRKLGMTNPTSWIQDSIGTVHTFQGKEAETVILLLGAPNENQSGARNWAASSVNLLNVAVSRAKRNFYVVGNRRLWAEAGKMPSLVREISKSK